MSDQQYYGFDDDMFSAGTKINFHGFKNGEHKFRVLPPYAPGKLFLQVDLHWGFTDENGRKKALKCTKYSHKTCAICDEVDKLKGQVELLKGLVPTSEDHKKELTKQITDLEARIGDIKKKPTYLWNIMLDSGEQKVLQLSWNGHDPLNQKVKFYWEQKKINVTDPRNSYGLWCSRTGEKAKTRYQYEVLDQTVRALTDLKPLVDLGKVYKESTPQELKQIVDQGFVGLPSEDPNDRQFAADMPSGIPAENQAKQEAPQTETKAPVYETPKAENLAVQPSAPTTLATDVAKTADEEAEALMKALQG